MKLAATLVTLCLAAPPELSAAREELQPAPASAEGPSDPPGGYHRMGEWSEPKPKDGHTEIIVGSIMTPLGGFRTALGIGQVVAASGQNCTRLVVEGFGGTTADCATLRTLGWVGFGFGALMLAAGVVSLAIGLRRREKYRAWKLRYARTGLDRLPPPRLTLGRF